MLTKAIKELFESKRTFRLVMHFAYQQNVVYERQKIYSEEHSELGYNDLEAFIELNPPYVDNVLCNFFHTWSASLEHKILVDELEQFIKKESHGQVYGIEISFRPDYHQRWNHLHNDQEFFTIKTQLSMENAGRWIQLHTELTAGEE